jgi:hypothetical protein
MTQVATRNEGIGLCLARDQTDLIRPPDVSGSTDRAEHDLRLDRRSSTRRKMMKRRIQLSTAALVTFLMGGPAFAQDKAAPSASQPAAENAKATPWWATDKFKEKFKDWSDKFAAARAATLSARAANKAITEAHKAEKDMAAKARMMPELISKRLAVWEADIAWLELHKQWKHFDCERAQKQWDEQIAKIKERIAKAKEQLAKVSEAARSEPPKK